MTIRDLPSRSTTGEQVAELIRDQIMSGGLKRGAALREESIANDFQVSRRTVRDALRVLEDNGLVRHQRHKGSTVTDFGVADINDMYESRRLLEVGAAQWWCEQPEDVANSRFAALEDAYDLLALMMQRGDTRRIVEADLAFHARIIGLLGSPRVDKFFSTIATEMVYALAILESSLRESETRPDASLAEHRAIFDALATKSSPLAAELVEEHIHVNRARLVTIVTDGG
ncbi:GntR family transcriptional regulator (plasmid) [Mycolicibacterium psychrotolerans]|uniref:GntR family transcriptional regulator n=1 Tax=Mycolicibacterium psychrotolerans TaxID=216929 RepID=UPI003D67EE3A